MSIETNETTLMKMRIRRYRGAAQLLRAWMEEDPSYDERAGAALEESLKGDPVRFREFDEPRS